MVYFAILLVAVGVILALITGGMALYDACKNSLLANSTSDFWTDSWNEVGGNVFALLAILLFSIPVYLALTLFIAIRSLAGARNPIHGAVQAGRYDVVERFLIRDPSLVHSQDSGGRTPLHIAVSKNHHSLVKLLLTMGAHPDAVDAAGKRPLDVVAATRAAHPNRFMDNMDRVESELQTKLAGTGD